MVLLTTNDVDISHEFNSIFLDYILCIMFTLFVTNTISSCLFPRNLCKLYEKIFLQYKNIFK